MPKNQSPTNQSLDSQLNDSQSKILKNLSYRMTDDYFNRKNFPLRSEGANNNSEVEDINAYIKKSAKRLSGQEESNHEVIAPIAPDPTAFNGVSGAEEERLMLLEQMKHLERENLKLKHQLDLLAADYQSEKRQLSSTIRDLKTELHRTAPLTENKFFTFSKDLRAVVSAVNSLSDEQTQDLPAQTPPADPIISTPLELPKTPPADPSPPPPPPTANPQPAANEAAPPVPPKFSKKTKTIITAATAVAIVTFSVALTMFNRKPAVNQTLVTAYLNDKGSVAGVATDAVNPEEGSPIPPARKEFKNNEVSFADTQWEVFRDEFLGFQVRYPGNATDLLATANTITFLRKDGYLLKMQRIQTEKTLEEYWTQIKADSLKYKIESVKQGPFDALHLILDETIEYPGNRYLVKVNDHIIDVWYATPNAKFNDDDMKRVDYMIQSMRFL